MHSGYIGGSVLQRILNHPRASSFDITVLVRDAKKAQLLESKFGLKAVIGSLEDADKLTEQSANAHIVIHTVSIPERRTSLLDVTDSPFTGRLRSCTRYQGHPRRAQEAP